MTSATTRTTPEQLYRLLADNATDVVTLHDLAGHYLYVSPSVTTLGGYQPEDVIGQACWRFMHPEDIAPVQQEMARAVVEGEIVTVEYRWLHAAGHWEWVETTARCVGEEIQCSTRGVGERRAALARQAVVARLGDLVMQRPAAGGGARRGGQGSGRDARRRGREDRRARGGPHGAHQRHHRPPRGSHGRPDRRLGRPARERRRLPAVRRPHARRRDRSHALRAADPPRRAARRAHRTAQPHAAARPPRARARARQARERPRRALLPRPRQPQGHQRLARPQRRRRAAARHRAAHARGAARGRHRGALRRRRVRRPVRGHRRLGARRR